MKRPSGHWESNQGHVHLACAASVLRDEINSIHQFNSILPLSYDNQTTTPPQSSIWPHPHSPLYVVHRWDWNASIFREPNPEHLAWAASVVPLTAGQPPPSTIFCKYCMHRWYWACLHMLIVWQAVMACLGEFVNCLFFALCKDFTIVDNGWLKHKSLKMDLSHL